MQGTTLAAILASCSSAPEAVLPAENSMARTPLERVPTVAEIHDLLNQLEEKIKTWGDGNLAVWLAGQMKRMPDLKIEKPFIHDFGQIRTFMDQGQYETASFRLLEASNSLEVFITRWKKEKHPEPEYEKTRQQLQAISNDMFSVSQEAIWLHSRTPRPVRGR